MTEPAEYAREIETYLCRKNRGHLVRVVGPAFDLVCGWANSGVPLKVAFKGIDRCCERQEARAGSGRRRPVRIEFCEADVLDAFDEWRRAVGVPAGTGEEEGRAPRKPALASHIERVIARLAHARGTGAPSTALHHRIDQIIRDLENVAADATRVRGTARTAIVDQLAALDAQLMAAAVAELDSGRATHLRAEADEELAGFGSRMPAEAAFTRLVRESAALPTIGYE